MALTFRSLWEHMDESPLMDSGLNSQALTTVRAGEDLHGDEETSFWDEFISLCSNSQGMADLLDVSADKVSNWPAKIKEYRDKLDAHSKENPSTPDEKEVVPTGQTGAFVTNQDPFMGNMR